MNVSGSMFEMSGLRRRQPQALKPAPGGGPLNVLVRTSFLAAQGFPSDIYPLQNGERWSGTNESTGIGANSFSVTPQSPAQGNLEDGSIGPSLNGVGVAHNNPNGSGGRAYESWFYEGDNNSPKCLLNVAWPNGQTPNGYDKIAIRWYMSYHAGMSWTTGAALPHYHKIWRFDLSLPNALRPNAAPWIIGWQDGYLNLFDGGNNPFTHNGATIAAGGIPYYWNQGWDPNGTPGAYVSDGSWHCFEIVFDSSNHSTVTGWLYVDGVLKGFRTISAVNEYMFYWMHNSNQNTPFPTGGAACFYDDIVVATYDGGTPPAGGVIGVYDAVRGF